MNKTDEYTDGVSENSDENIVTSSRFGLKGQTVQDDDSDGDNMDELILLDDPEDTCPEQQDEETHLTEKRTPEEQAKLEAI